MRDVVMNKGQVARPEQRCSIVGKCGCNIHAVGAPVQTGHVRIVTTNQICRRGHDGEGACVVGAHTVSRGHGNRRAVRVVVNAVCVDVVDEKVLREVGVV